METHGYRVFVDTATSSSALHFSDAVDALLSVNALSAVKTMIFDRRRRKLDVAMRRADALTDPYTAPHARFRPAKRIIENYSLPVVYIFRYMEASDRRFRKQHVFAFGIH